VSVPAALAEEAGAACGPAGAEPRRPAQRRRAQPPGARRKPAPHEALRGARRRAAPACMQHAACSMQHAARCAAAGPAPPRLARAAAGARARPGPFSRSGRLTALASSVLLNGRSRTVTSAAGSAGSAAVFPLRKACTSPRAATPHARADSNTSALSLPSSTSARRTPMVTLVQRHIKRAPLCEGAWREGRGAGWAPERAGARPAVRAKGRQLARRSRRAAQRARRPAALGSAQAVTHSADAPMARPPAAAR
jgi:hypothetical protein